jgi:hypothetical protein
VAGFITNAVGRVVAGLREKSGDHSGGVAAVIDL